MPIELINNLEMILEQDILSKDIETKLRKKIQRYYLVN